MPLGVVWVSNRLLIYSLCLVHVFALSNALFVQTVKPKQSLSTLQLEGTTEIDLRPQSLPGPLGLRCNASLSFDAGKSGALVAHRTCQGHANNGNTGLLSLAHCPVAPSSI